MKLTRRALLKVTGATIATAGCGVAQDPADGDASTDASLDGAESSALDAQPNDALSDASPDGAPDASATDGGNSDARTDGATTNPDFAGIPQNNTLFPLGVMAGDALSTSVIVWTYYDGTDPLVLRVLEMDGATVAAVRFDDVIRPDAAGFARFEVTGLTPGKHHRYAFITLRSGMPAARSRIGRVRTALGDTELAPITFAGTSCTRIGMAPFPVLAHAGGRTDIDFFFGVGDQIYADYDDAGAATTLDAYRTKYARYWATAGKLALHASCGVYHTWDDHEVANNWDPETFSATQSAAARRAFFENNPIRRNLAAPDRIWRSFRWGRTAEVFMLDCRSERRPSTRLTTSAQYISRLQMDWLKAGLMDSPCVFKLIANSVPISSRGAAGEDNWTGYAAQRTEILRHIADQNIRGVLWVSGDVHYGAVAGMQATGAFSNMWEVIMGPGGNRRSTAPGITMSAQYPVVVYPEVNYTVFRADPTTRTVNVEFIDPMGAVIAGSRWSHRFA